MEVFESAYYVKARAALDVWLGWVVAALQLEDFSIKVVCLPKTTGRNILSARQCIAQTVHDFEHWKTSSRATLFL